MASRFPGSGVQVGRGCGLIRSSLLGVRIRVLADGTSRGSAARGPLRAPASGTAFPSQPPGPRWRGGHDTIRDTRRRDAESAQRSPPALAAMTPVPLLPDLPPPPLQSGLGRPKSCPATALSSVLPMAFSLLWALPPAGTPSSSRPVTEQNGGGQPGRPAGEGRTALQHCSPHDSPAALTEAHGFTPQPSPGEMLSAPARGLQSWGAWGRIINRVLGKVSRSTDHSAQDSGPQRVSAVDVPRPGAGLCWWGQSSRNFRNCPHPAKMVNSRLPSRGGSGTGDTPSPP